MPDVPKIVYERLRAGAPVGAHPDPDVLAAFAEQTLLPVEREGVLEHLALCGDCRAVISLALPASESVAVSQVAPETETNIAAETEAARVMSAQKRSWFAWPSLRWAALAAGVVVAGAVLLQHSGKPGQSAGNKTPAPTAISEAGRTSAAKRALEAPPAHSENALTAELKPAQNAPVTRRAQVPESRAANARMLNGNPAGSMMERAKAVPAGTEFALGNLEAKARAEETPTKTRPPEAQDIEAQGKDQAAGAVFGKSTAAPSPSLPAARETVEVTAASPPVETARADMLIARNEPAPAISKAKAPTADEAAAPPKAAVLAKKQDAANPAFANTYSLQSEMRLAASQQAPPVQWSIAAGTLQRSLDNSATWQTVLRGGNRLLCYAAQATSIWAGGKSGTLYHSTDAGATWNEMHPSTHERTLATDVTHIEVSGLAHIILSTSNGETWTTSDNGKNWTVK